MTPAPKRRWFRWSLRTMFVVVTLLALWLGSLASSAHQQKAATDAIRKAGGRVTYDYEIDKSDMRLLNATPIGPTWFRNLIGRDWFDTVVEILLDDPRWISASASDEELAKSISRLPRTKYLHLRFPPAGERTLRALSNTPHLTALFLNGSEITDKSLPDLYHLNELVNLYLDDTEVTEDGLSRIKQTLPGCLVADRRRGRPWRQR